MKFTQFIPYTQHKERKNRNKQTRGSNMAACGINDGI